MPEQPTITDIRSFYGLVNQLAPFVATSPLMEPFRELLKRFSHKKVYWDEQLQHKFEEAKRVPSKLAQRGLRYYDKDRPTELLTDWSRNGMGFVAMRQYCSCSERDTPFFCKDGWRLWYR